MRTSDAIDIIFEDIKSMGLYTNIILAIEEGYIDDAKFFIYDLTNGENCMMDYLIENERYEDCAFLKKEIEDTKDKF